MSSNGRSRLRFGQLELDLPEGKLLRRGRSVHLENQPLQILSALLERPGEVVSREELRSSLWPQGTYVDFDEGLNTAIKKLRYALGDSAENPIFIETVPRRGYRFLAPVIQTTQVETAAPDSKTLADAGTSRERPEPAHRQWWWAAGWGAVALLLIIGAIFWLRRVRRSSSDVPPAEFQQLTISPPESLLSSGAISPDGKYLAFADVAGMHIKLLGTDEIQTVASPEAFKNDRAHWEIVSTAWFPDSTRFLANSDRAGTYRWYGQRPNDWLSEDRSVWVVSVLGGTPRKLRDDAFAWSVSPDGSSIFFSTNKGILGDRELWSMGVNGGEAHKLYSVSDKSAVCCLQFLPQTQRISYIVSDEYGDTRVARDLRDGQIKTLIPPSEMKKMGDSAWLPDGRLIYSDACIPATLGFDTACNYWLERLDPRTGEIVEKPRRLTNFAGFWMSSPSVTADGRHVAFLKSTGRGTGYLADLEAGETRVLNSKRFTSQEGGEDAIADWTADSRDVIVIQNRGDHYGLYRQALNSEVLEPIIVRADGGLLEEAIVSPDGKWVILQVWPITNGPTVDLMRVPITGGSPEFIFKVAEGSMSFCARPPSMLCAVAQQSEDRKQMTITAFDPEKGRGRELSRFDLDPDYNLNTNYSFWSISPDGTRLAAVQGPKGPLLIRSVRGGPTQVIKTQGWDRIGLLNWTADGNGLIVSRAPHGAGEIVHVDLKGKVATLVRCSSDRCFGFPSPDGRHLAFYDWKASTNVWMMENF